MKILHTSDWHLGQVFYNYDRTDEQQSFLRQLVRIVVERQPDAVVVSGDIFHTPSPSSAVQRMYVEAMLDVHRACPHATIVVTAGNHDSASKLEIDSSLWRHFNLHVIGGIARRGDDVDWDRHIIGVHAADGSLAGYVAAVPHVYPQNFPALPVPCGGEERMQAFFARLQELARGRAGEHLPVVMMAHLSVSGADMTGHESVGGLDTADWQTIDNGCDYMALGHIHCPQTLGGTGGRARYSGSPLPVSFDEAYEHSVSLVDVEAGRRPAVTVVAIDNPHPCVTVPRVALPFEEALRELGDFPADIPAYIRLNVAADGYLAPDSNERAAAVIADKRCKLCMIKVSVPEPKGDDTVHQLTISEMKRMSPVDVATLYYKSVTGKDMDETMLTLLQTAYMQVIEDEKQQD